MTQSLHGKDITKETFQKDPTEPPTESIFLHPPKIQSSLSGAEIMNTDKKDIEKVIFDLHPPIVPPTSFRDVGTTMHRSDDPHDYIVRDLHDSWTPHYSELVTYYKLNECMSAPTIQDSVGENHGSLIGNVRLCNSMVSFEGGRCDVPFSFINYMFEGTIAVWIYIPEAPTHVMTICAKQHNGQYSNAILNIGNWKRKLQDGRIYWSAHNAFGVDTAVSQSVLEPKQWYHIAITFTASTCTIYVNGKVDSITEGRNFVIPHNLSGTGACLGTWPGDGGGNPFRGYMQDFAVWNVELSKDDIATIYEMQTK